MPEYLGPYSRYNDSLDNEEVEATSVERSIASPSPGKEPGP